MFLQSGHFQKNKTALMIAAVGIVWLSGMLIGSWFASEISCTAETLMRSLPGTKTSLLGVLFASTAPVLLLLYADRYLGRRGLYLLIFAKAILLGLAVSASYRSFGTAGWLITPILLASDLLSAYLMIVYALWLLCNKGNTSRRFFLSCLSGSVLVALFDQLVTSSFIASVF